MNNYLNQLILIIFLVFAAFLGAQVKNLYKRFVTTEVKQAVCRTAVRFVEQVYRDIHGEEKLHVAMAKASELLAEYGIRISEDELIAMLEAAVNEFNKSFEINKSLHQTGEGDKPPDVDSYASLRYGELPEPFGKG